MTVLPIEARLPEITRRVGERRRLMIRAEPGAGKTTRVPIALLEAGLAGERDVLVVEPRRIAARAAASFVARERGEAVGGAVGYQVRFERAGGAGTRLWYVTEGVFGRRLVADPFLETVGMVVLDEFHERHLDGDLAFAVVRHLQETVRPELALVLMSATLDAARLQSSLPDATLVDVAGRAHPVAVEYLDDGTRRSTPERVATALARLLGGDDDGGDVLVILAGARDIRRSAEAIAPLARAHALEVQMLHGMQPLAEQERVLRPATGRRVVLATNVAETALTVEGVTAVIDAGEARIARLDARLGINRLDLVPISHASAAQRAGRAGRTGPGRCVRLWSRAEDVGRRDAETPEILRLDLTRLVLAVAGWGMAGVDELPWPSPPPAPAVARARRLLADLGALGSAGLTAMGRRMLACPLEPRLARVALEAERLGAGAQGALLAALAGERDIVRRALGPAGSSASDWPTGPSDLLLRMALFADAARAGFAPDRCRALGLDVGAVRTVERVRRQVAAVLEPGSEASDAALLQSLLAGSPDRVARRRTPGDRRAVMVGSTGVALAPESVVRDAELFVCIEVEGGRPGRERREAVVRLASAVERRWLEELPGGLDEASELVWDESRARVVERRRVTYRDLVLSESIRTDVDREQAGAIVAAIACERPAEAWALDAAGQRLLDRLRFLAATMPALGLPADPTELLREAARACAARCVSLGELRGRSVGAALTAQLAPAVHRALATEAPADWVLPTGRRVAVAYPPDGPPRIAARIQELFGTTATPRLGGGRVALVVELLAPNGRPVQVTGDLGSFWGSAYADVRRQLRGRYPKHDWPVDPERATPSAGPKRRARGPLHSGPGSD